MDGGRGGEGREGGERTHTNTHTNTQTHEHTNTSEHTNTWTHEHTHTHTHEHTNTHTHTHKRTHTRTSEHTHEHTSSTTVAVCVWWGGCPPSERVNKRTKKRTKRRESPWQQLLHPLAHSLAQPRHPHPVPGTLSPPTPASQPTTTTTPRSVVSARQAGDMLRKRHTELTHTVVPARSTVSQRYGGMGYHITPPTDTLGADRLYAVSPRATNTHTHIHNPHTRSQLTTTEPKLVQSDDMSDWVNYHSSSRCLNSSYTLVLLLQNTLIYQLFLSLQKKTIDCGAKQNFNWDNDFNWDS